MGGLRKYLWTALGVIVVEFLVAPIGGRVFNNVFPQAGAPVIPEIPLYHWGYASLFAVGLLAGAAIVTWQKRKAGALSKMDPPEKADRTVLRILFRRNQDPLELSDENVWRWFVYKVTGQHEITGEQRIISTQIIITFDKPINPLYRRVTCSKSGALPNVIDLSPRSAIITVDQADLADAVMEIEFNSKPI